MSVGVHTFRQSYDQPAVAAIIVTFQGQVIPVKSIESLTTSKTEDGNAGTFSFTCPAVPNMAAVLATNPNDIVAIYGIRPSTDGRGLQDLGPSLPLPVLTANGWGNQATIRGLQSPTLMFLGMVDSADEHATPGGAASFSVSGRDLTKIFLEYDCGYFNTPTRQALFTQQPTPGGLSSKQKQLLANKNLSDIMNAIATFEINTTNSGTNLLEVMLDTAMARDFTTSANLQAGNLPPLNADQKSYLAEFGFPWRQWVLTDKLDPGFRHYTSGPTFGLTYQLQPGSMWANCQEMRNEPFNRLFVTEDGFLIFDEALNAYVSQAPVLDAVRGDDIRDFETNFSDDTLATFLAVLGALEISRGNIASAVSTAPEFGTIAGLGYAAFIGGTGQAVNAGGDGDVQRYGFRAKTLISNFDQGTNQKAMADLFQFITAMLNNQLTATLTVKGRPEYRIGQRLLVEYGNLRPETQNATWYVAGVGQSYDFGSDWTTTLRLLYPNTVYGIPGSGGAVLI